MQQFIDRISSPISGTFFASWMLWNWKIVLIVFDSGISVFAKIDEIKLLANRYESFWWPLLSGCIYFIIMPLLLITVRKFTDYVKILNDLKDTQKGIVLGNIQEFDKRSQAEIGLMMAKEIEAMCHSIKKYSEQINVISQQIGDFSIANKLADLHQKLDVVATTREHISPEYKDIVTKINSRYFSKYGVNFSTTQEIIVDLYAKIFTKKSL